MYIISQEIYNLDPFTRIQSLKVRIVQVVMKFRRQYSIAYNLKSIMTINPSHFTGLKKYTISIIHNITAFPSIRYCDKISCLYVRYQTGPLERSNMAFYALTFARFLWRC